MAGGGDTGAVDAWVADLLGPTTLETVLTRRAGRVVRVRDAGGTCWIVKTTGSAHAHARERRAYEQWVPHLADQAPHLVAADDALQTLVLEDLRGCTGWRPDPGLHREAGRLLARLHGAAPPVRRGPQIGHLMQGRLRTTRERLPAGAVEPAALRAAEQAVATLLRDHPDLPRVPTHGDYGGHNWLQGDGPLRVIDFSLSRVAPATLDFARLVLGSWWQRPELAAAFFDGYGRPMTEQEHACVRLQLPVLAVSLVARAARVGNADAERRGRQRLQQLLDGVDPGTASAGPARRPALTAASGAARRLLARRRTAAWRPSASVTREA